MTSYLFAVFWVYSFVLGQLRNKNSLSNNMYLNFHSYRECVLLLLTSLNNIFLLWKVGRTFYNGFALWLNYFSFQISKEAKECVQECVSEFISFITSEYPFDVLLKAKKMYAMVMSCVGMCMWCLACKQDNPTCINLHESHTKYICLFSEFSAAFVIG